MNELLAAALSYPTLVYTVLLGVALGYWLLVMVGALAVDSLDFELEGDAEVEVDADGPDAEVNGAAALSGLSLRKVPLTIAATLLFFIGWLLCNMTTHYFGALLSALAPVAVWGTLVLVLSTLAALFIANLLSMPLAPLFDTHEAARRGDLIGKVIEVRTGRVDREFGQGAADDGGAGLLVQIRCEPERLKRGDKALVIAHDEAEEFYEVEPLDEILAEREQGRQQ